MNVPCHKPLLFSSPSLAIPQKLHEAAPMLAQEDELFAPLLDINTIFNPVGGCWEKQPPFTTSRGSLPPGGHRSQFHAE